MGKVAIIIESREMSTKELETQCHRIFTKQVDYLLPDDREIYIVPSDEE